MSSNNISRNHHFIPQFFLNSFAKYNGKRYITSVFDKNNLKAFTQSVNNIGYIKNFHTVEINGKETDFFETAHYRVYERWLAVKYHTFIKKLERVHQDIRVFNCLSDERCEKILNYEQVSFEEKKLISFMLAYFIVRGKKWRFFGEDVHNHLEKQMRDIGKAMKFNDIENNIINQIGLIDDIKKSQIQATFQGDEIEKIACYLYKHTWNIGFNMTNDFFYTSDNVHALTTMWNEQPEWMGVGYITPGNIVQFPLTPRICIIMYDPLYLDKKKKTVIDLRYVKLYERDVKSINNSMVLNSIDQVYSIDANWSDLEECYRKNKLEKGHKPYGIY